tara:strand:- start:714 stop:1070 length:357 start_codon:yes stop_codon:yes gene_type:complete
MAYNRPQYNTYPKKNYGSSSTDSTEGTARLVSTKKRGLILEVTLNNQNLVLQGFWNNQLNKWKLLPYFDKTKSNPQFNKPKYEQQGNGEPVHIQQWKKSPAPDPTDFNPAELDDELGN